MITKAEAAKILFDKEHQWKLFPHGRIITSWEPYNLKFSSNIPLFLSIVDNLVATPHSYKHSIESKALELSKIRQIMPHLHYSYKSLSFATATQVRNGVRYVVDYYSESPTDMYDVKLHIVQHLCLAPLYWRHKNIYIGITTPYDIKKEELEKAVVDNFGIENDHTINISVSLGDEPIASLSTPSKL